MVERHTDREPVVAIEVPRIGLVGGTLDGLVRQLRHREGDLVEVDVRELDRRFTVAVRELDRVFIIAAAIVLPAREREEPRGQLREREVVDPGVLALVRTRGREDDDAARRLDVDAGDDLAVPALDVEAIERPREEVVVAGRRRARLERRRPLAAVLGDKAREVAHAVDAVALEGVGVDDQDGALGAGGEADAGVRKPRIGEVARDCDRVASRAPLRAAVLFRLVALLRPRRDREDAPAALGAGERRLEYFAIDETVAAIYHRANSPVNRIAGLARAAADRLE